MTRWLVAALLVLLALLGAPAQAQPIVIDRMQVLASDAATPPADDAAWEQTLLPDAVESGSAGVPVGATWYRGSFQGPVDPVGRATWAVYLPYLYEGGQVWLNGSVIGAIAETTPDSIVRWERPHLLPLPASLLKPGANVLAVRTAAAPRRATGHFPRVQVGEWRQLQPAFDRRMFWVRTMPQVTVVVCMLVAGFVLFIYWRRRSEVLYGLFGLAAALWGLRTLTFVIEAMPTANWYLWRLVYHTATGGFITILALFALRFAAIRRPAVETALLLYWLLGPLWLLLGGPQHEALVNRIWTAGMMPIGVALLATSVWATLRQRTLPAAVLTGALLIGVLTGVHDYLIAWNAPLLERLWPDWAGQRIFLLHYGADILLLAMGGLLTARFVQALTSLETVNRTLAELNHTLESRVAERERRLAANFENMAALQRQHAASQERQLIMREIHDGLGSRLFTSLSRVERGDMDDRTIAETLRACIADMRLALDALAPDDDFQVALGNFLFRWHAQMLEAHIQPAWSIDVPDSALKLAPQSALQLLRIAQEALTNVLKHAKARHVRVELRQRADVLELEVTDDGIGADLSPDKTGHGITNMRARARRLGGRIDVLSTPRGTRVLLEIPVADEGMATEPGTGLPRPAFRTSGYR